MTPDEIVRSLRACGRNDCDNCECYRMGLICRVKNFGAADLIEQQAEKIKELEAKLPRWIPVTERLPKVESWKLSDIVNVLVTVQNYNLFTGEATQPYVTSAAYNAEQLIFDINGRGAINAAPIENGKLRTNVTYWMPLPVRPEEVNDG